MIILLVLFLLDACLQPPPIALCHSNIFPNRQTETDAQKTITGASSKVINDGSADLPQPISTLSGFPLNGITDQLQSRTIHPRSLLSLPLLSDGRESLDNRKEEKKKKLKIFTFRRLRIYRDYWKTRVALSSALDGGEQLNFFILFLEVCVVYPAHDGREELH